MLTYNRTLPNISEVARKNGHILQINPEFRNVFLNKPRTAFTRNKNIQDLMWPFNKGWKSWQEEIRKKGKVKARNVVQQDHLYVVCKW